uniref:Uncharacterized protein n=1 Tax=Opuntia streptacantha TaxID=393608 RepID=A0A7C9DUH5_OPUST
MLLQVVPCQNHLLACFLNQMVKKNAICFYASFLYHEASHNRGHHNLFFHPENFYLYNSCGDGLDPSSCRTHDDAPFPLALTTHCPTPLTSFGGNFDHQSLFEKKIRRDHGLHGPCSGIDNHDQTSNSNFGLQENPKPDLQSLIELSSQTWNEVFAFPFSISMLWATEDSEEGFCIC